MVIGDKWDRLRGFIEDLGPCAVAFSGGVDSGLVAAAASSALGDRAAAVTVESELSPEVEGVEAARVAGAIGIRHILLKVSVLGSDAVSSNPVDRCYHCKMEVFRAIKDAAAKDGLATILDGTNADDLKCYRPGLRALAEMGVVSPLARLGFTKAEVRELAKGIGLPNWGKPSAPCLATRFPYGARLTEEGIRRVGLAEEFIRSLGVRVLRVRDHGALARIEVEPDEMPRLVARGVREKVVARLRSLGYNYVSLDMEGYRSGSMDIGKTEGELCAKD